MMTDTVVIGKIVKMPEIRQEGLNSVGMIEVETERPFHTADGKVIKDRIPVKLWRGITEECVAGCREGMTVALRGRLETGTDDDGRISLYVLAEKVILHLQ